MTRRAAAIEFHLPDWAAALAAKTDALADIDTRMAFVLKAARRNIETRSGGPFAAAVFERDSGRLVSLGVNIVERGGLSLLHAEIVAMALAQKTLGAYDLGAAGLPAHQLVSSAEPCAMCLGALPWSGIASLVSGARGEDVEAVGFDEGDKPADWPAGLKARGVAVERDVRRSEAAEILRLYGALGGRVYNPAGPVDRNS